MPVECNFFGPLREAVGEKTVDRDLEVDGEATVADLVSDLVAEYPALAEGLLDDDSALHDAVNVTVNKENINHLDGTATVLEDGDVVRFASAVIGGCDREASRRRQGVKIGSPHLAGR